MKLKLSWITESIDRGADINVGAIVGQITSAPLISHNIYCEERYTSADGNRLAFLRSPIGQAPEQLWMYDFHSGNIALLSDEVGAMPTSNIYSDALYFVRSGKNTARALTRLDLKTLEMDEVFDLGKCPLWRHQGSAIAPDESYYVSNFRVSSDVFGLFRVDLQKGTWEVFHEHKDICNPHVQFEPSRGADLLVQLNNGAVLDEEDNFIRLVGEQGATLYAIDKDGGNQRHLPFGGKHSAPISGHECWVGDTGQILLTLANGELCAAAPGDAASRRVSAAGFGQATTFGFIKKMHPVHISCSRDGQHYVTEDFSNGRLYVGNVATGRILPLCDSGASCASPQYTHPHAYMTPNNSHVVFNCDGQVRTVRIPEGFLEWIG